MALGRSVAAADARGAGAILDFLGDEQLPEVRDAAAQALVARGTAHAEAVRAAVRVRGYG